MSCSASKSKNQILAVVIVFAILPFVCWFFQSVKGQTLNPANFVTYQNPTLGFSLQHPSNWHIFNDELLTVLDNERGESVVRFCDEHRSCDDVLPLFTITTKKISSYLDTDTMTVKNASLQQSVQDKLNSYSTTSVNYKLIRQNEVSIAGNIGSKIELTNLNAMGDFYTFDVLTIANGQLYILEYNEFPLDVPKTLPLANKVVESFKFIK